MNKILAIGLLSSILNLGNSYDAIAQLGSPTVINVTPLSIAAASNNDSAIQMSSTSILYTVGSSCEAIAMVTSTADLGTLNASVTVLPTSGSYYGAPFVRRYYTIRPSMNATSSANIVLYFSQADIDDYNNAAAVLSGDYPPIDGALSNLLITVYHGNPTDGTTGPFGEFDTTNKEVIVPTVTFNTEYNYYEVSFTTNGFSRFIAHTSPTVAPLPITISPLTGINKDGGNQLFWEVYQIEENATIELQSSQDATAFNTIYKMPQPIEHNKKYNYYDNNEKENTTYYRLIITDKQGQINYSNVVVISNEFVNNITFSAYPNPMEDKLNVSIKGKIEPNANIVLIDAKGIVLNRQNITQEGTYYFNTENLAQGSYFLQFTNGSQKRSIKTNKK